MTIIIFLPSSVESCERGHVLCQKSSREEDVCPSGPKKERLILGNFLPFPSIEMWS